MAIVQSGNIQFSNFSTLARAGEFSNSGNVFKWINTSNAQTSNNQYAQLQWTTSGGSPVGSDPISGSGYVNYLVCTQLSSSIPAGSTINGITVKIERYNSEGGETLTITDNAIYLTKDGTNTVGTNKSAAATWPLSTDPNTYENFGSSSDLWGTTWTAAEINASTFGVMISPNLSISLSGSNAGNNTKIDQITIDINYTTSGVASRRAIFTSGAELRTI
jgi:hypothetical protein